MNIPLGATRITLTNYRIKPKKYQKDRTYVVFDIYFFTNTSSGMFGIWMLNCFAYRNARDIIVWTPPITKGSGRLISLPAVKVNKKLYDEVQAQIEEKFSKVLVKKEYTKRTKGERFASADDAIQKFLTSAPEVKLLESGKDETCQTEGAD